MSDNRQADDVILVSFDGQYIFPRTYKDHKGMIIHDGLVSYEEKARWNTSSGSIEGISSTLNTHINNSNIHLTQEEKQRIDNNASETKDGIMSKEDKKKLDSIFDVLYPVGTVYESTQNITPTIGEFIWTLIGDIEVGTKTVYFWERTV